MPEQLSSAGDHAFNRVDDPVSFITEVMKDRTLNLYDRMVAARHLVEISATIPYRNIFDQMKLTRADIEALAATIARWERGVVRGVRFDGRDLDCEGHG
jgi:hypothetical protein